MEGAPAAAGGATERAGGGLRRAGAGDILSGPSFALTRNATTVNDAADPARARAAAAARRPTGDATRFLIPGEQLPPASPSGWRRPGCRAGRPAPGRHRGGAPRIARRAGVAPPASAPPQRLRRGRLGLPRRGGGRRGRGSGARSPQHAAPAPRPGPVACGMATPRRPSASWWPRCARRGRRRGILLAEPEGERPRPGGCCAARASISSRGCWPSRELVEPGAARPARPRTCSTSPTGSPRSRSLGATTRASSWRACPAGAECELHGEELTEARWLRPGEAVRSYREGELVLLPPTIHTLEPPGGFALPRQPLERASATPPCPPSSRGCGGDPGGILLEIDGESRAPVSSRDRPRAADGIRGTNREPRTEHSPPGSHDRSIPPRHPRRPPGLRLPPASR